MLKPDKNDPNYSEQMKKYEKDNSDWGEDHTRLDMIKRRGAAQPSNNGARSPSAPDRR